MNKLKFKKKVLVSRVFLMISDWKLFASSGQTVTQNVESAFWWLALQSYLGHNTDLPRRNRQKFCLSLSALIKLCPENGATDYIQKSALKPKVPITICSLKAFKELMIWESHSKSFLGDKNSLHVRPECNAISNQINLTAPFLFWYMH